jgi:hypothetical protein
VDEGQSADISLVDFNGMHLRGRGPLWRRCLGIGAGFTVFALTHSWVALAFGVPASMTAVPIARWTLRRLGQSLD